MDDKQNTPWQYKADGSGDTNAGESDEPSRALPKNRSNLASDISWEAPEFIEHHHGPGWYGALTLGTLTLSALVFLLSSKDVAATAIVLVLGIIVGVFAGHKPASLTYTVSRSGLRVGEKLYKYHDYKSFSIIGEGELYSVNLIPLKRLSPPVAAYFDPADEKKITDALGEYLPYEKRGLDPIDRIARRLRL